MRPASVLRAYCAISFVLGVVASFPLAWFVKHGELSLNASAVLLLCLNVLLIMILPLVLDFSERKYFKARFLQLEEIAQSNPQLKALLEEQCQKLSLPGLRVAAVETTATEMLVYGLWHQNPRLVLPASWLRNSAGQTNLLPSIEIELNRFAKREVSFLFLGFFLLQVAVQFGVVTLWPH
jgi:hypothetical protein